MKRRLVSFLILSAVVIPGLLVTAGCPVPYKPDTGASQWQSIDPVTNCEYYVYVPKKYDHRIPMKVIVSCHGTPPFDVAEHHIRTWKWYGEKYGCIIVCPSLKGTDGIFGDGPVSAMLENERNLTSILSTLSYMYNLDRNNVMITGFSGGGFPAYWIGLRHPELFSVIVAQNCNFNENNLDGWYPPEARSIPLMVYYGENDPATIIVQSQNAIAYLKKNRFNVRTYVIPGAGHDRHPEVAMDFFRKNWRQPSSTARKIVGPTEKTEKAKIMPAKQDKLFELRGPRPPEY